MKERIKNGIQVSITAMLLLAPTLALAGAGAGYPPSIADLRINWPPFLLFFGLMFFLLRKPFLSFWQKRSEQIRTDLYAGERMLEQAQVELEQARERRAQLDSEVLALRETIAREAQQEQQEIVSQARERADRIREQASLTLSAEKQALESAVRKELAEKVIENAREKLVQSTDASTDSRYRGAAFSQFGSLLRQ